MKNARKGIWRSKKVELEEEAVSAVLYSTSVCTFTVVLLMYWYLILVGRNLNGCRRSFPR